MLPREARLRLNDGRESSLVAHRPEGMFGHCLMMVSALGGRECAAIGNPFSEYENAAGTGQVHVWFERPAKGWRAPAPG